jgi:cytidylate kinase
VELHIIAVSGLAGSGTTSASRRLAARLQWGYINAGSIFRTMAAEAGVSLAEFGRRAEEDSRIDLRLDARMVEEARLCGRVILEGRVTGWMAARHGLPALKVWLRASAPTRAARLGRRDGQTPEQAWRAMEEREGSEAARYARHHAIDMADLSVYDLVVDTELHPPREVAELIISCLQRREGGE